MTKRILKKGKRQLLTNINNNNNNNSNSNSNSSSNQFQHLPLEIILLIFRHIYWPERSPTLYACSLVSKRFHASVNPLIWGNPNLPCTTIVQRLLTSLDHVPIRQYQHQLSSSSSLSTSPGKHIQQLYLHGDFLTNTHFVRLLPHLPSLEHFTIPSRTKITDLGIQRLPRHCPRLTFLELHHNTLSRSTIIALGRHCHHLRDLQLRHCHLEPHRDLFQPLTTLPNLQRLTLHQCTMDESSAVQYLVQLNHLTYIRLWGLTPHTMKTLLVSSGSAIAANADADAANASSLPTVWPNLKECGFLDAQDIDDLTWLAFIKTHPQLQEITLQDCPVTDASMQTMARSLPHLKGLLFIGDTPSLTSQGIRELIRAAFPSLQRVQCNHCTHIRVTDFDELTELPRPICFLDFIVDMDKIAIGRIRAAA